MNDYYCVTIVRRLVYMIHNNWQDRYTSQWAVLSKGSKSPVKRNLPRAHQLKSVCFSITRLSKSTLNFSDVNDLKCSHEPPGICNWKAILPTTIVNRMGLSDILLFIAQRTKPSIVLIVVELPVNSNREIPSEGPGTVLNAQQATAKKPIVTCNSVKCVP